MRFALGIILLCFCTFVGYFFAGKYIDRKKFYNDFVNFNRVLKQEILFNKKTLIEILDEQKGLSDFYFILENWFINKRINFEFNYLNDDDKKIIRSFLENLGTSDIDTQIDFINKTNEVVVVMFNQAIDLEKKYKTLYLWLLFCRIKVSYECRYNF